MSLLPVADAQRRLLAMARPVAAETVSLGEALGRWAAADVIASRPRPAHDLSAMDGYAIRFADLPGPVTVIGESAAGRMFAGSMSAGQAVRIFTGAVMPAGADTVLIQEEAARVGDTVTLAGSGPAAAGRNTRRRGSDFAAGDVLIARGDRLTAARLALAATAGSAALSVNRRLRVAIVATGDELVAPGEPVGDGQIAESNGIMLRALLADLPVDIIDWGIIPDRLDTLTARLAGVDADILVTTGGASVGDHDLVRPAIEKAGGSVDFWRIALRPGKPMMAGRIGDTLVLGLPGNPASAFVTAVVFLRPLIAAMGGAQMPVAPPMRAVLGSSLPANDARQDYLRAVWQEGRVVPAERQDSGVIVTLAAAECLIVRPPHAPAGNDGDIAEILTLA